MKRLWSGERSLPMSYWVFGYVAPLGVALILWVAQLIFGPLITPGSLTGKTAALLILAYMIIWSVGTWRSASKYEGLKIWPMLVKFHILMPIIGFAVVLSISSMIPR